MGFTIDTYQSMETRTAVLRLYRRIAPKAALLMVVYYCECFAVTNFICCCSRVGSIFRVGGVEKDTTCGALMRQTVLISSRVPYSPIPPTTHNSQNMGWYLVPWK